MNNDVFTLDENNNAAIRTVGVNGVAESNSPSVFTQDEDGNACIRVTGSGGSVDEDKVIVLSDTIPTADAHSLGKFYCYKGTTNASYTHGYIYECVAGSSYYTANIAFDQSTFASESFEKAGQLIVDAGVVDPTEVTGGTMTYALAGNLWSIVFTDANGNALNAAYNIYTDDLEQDYDILPVVDPSEFTDGQVVNMLINNIEEHQTYSWERVDVQPAAKLGRYLSGWNCATGLAMTNPQESPYEYTTGDYYIVGVVATGGASNYKPNGSSYTIGVASTTVETETVNVNDMYLYDGTNWTLLKTGSAVTSINGQVGDVNIKSVNGNSLMGSGNLELSTYLPYPSGWTTTSTTKAFCDDIAADTTAIGGKAYLGEVTCSDLPASMANAEIVVEIMSGSTANNKVIVLTCTSGNTAPYMWKYTYWNGGSDVSGWVTCGDTLPSQSGNSGKFLTTDGTDASWSDKPLTNKTSATNSLSVLGYNIGQAITSVRSIAVGVGAAAKKDDNIAIGWSADVGGGTGSVGIGSSIYINAKNAIAIGYRAQATAQGAIQLGCTDTPGSSTNSDANTVKVSNANGNFEMMSANGTIPTDRFTTTPVADGTYVPTVSISSGTATRSWTTPASAPVVPSTMPELTVAGWSNNAQSVTVSGVTASNIVIVAPAPASAADYAAAGIVCTAQGTDSLTFTCTTVPSNAITVNVIIMA